MDFRHQLRHWFPAEVNCYLRSNIQIDPRNTKVSAGTNQLPDIPQTFFGVRWSHVTQEIARDYQVLRPQDTNQPWVTDIPNVPRYSFSEPGLDCSLVSFPIEE